MLRERSKQDQKKSVNNNNNHIIGILMVDKVICPTCKQFNLRSKVFVVDMKPFFQTSGGYYNEDGHWVEWDSSLRMMRSFNCSFGHYWIRYI